MTTQQQPAAASRRNGIRSPKQFGTKAVQAIYDAFKPHLISDESVSRRHPTADLVVDLGHEHGPVPADHTRVYLVEMEAGEWVDAGAGERLDALVGTYVDPTVNLAAEVVIPAVVDDGEYRPKDALGWPPASAIRPNSNLYLPPEGREEDYRMVIQSVYGIDAESEA